MKQRRMLENASFRLSDSNVTHDVRGRSPSDVGVCQGLRKALSTEPSVAETMQPSMPAASLFSLLSSG